MGSRFLNGYELKLADAKPNSLVSIPRSISGRVSIAARESARVCENYFSPPLEQFRFSHTGHRTPLE
jgi:hypothetical protein